MTDSALNWIVPLRRVVVKRKLLYRELMQAWLELLAPTPKPGPESEDEPDTRTDAELGYYAVVLGIWYDDPDDNTLNVERFNRGVSRLRRWHRLTFRTAVITTSRTGDTRVQTKTPNFHARLWKGPKRVLLEQAALASDDEARLAELRPYELEGGQLRLQYDEAGEPRPIELLPGDVLEVPVHVFLLECEQQRFADLEFDPTGSFYLGTTVRSRSGAARTELPRLHDNMLAMRYQLAHALKMANCYHDAPVYTAENKIYRPRHAPEGAGVYARGMPYGGNPTLKPVATNDPSKYRWELGLLNTSIPEDDRPIYMPTHGDLARYAPDLPLTWGWVCSPFALFFFNFLADAHATNTGQLLSGPFRSESLGKSVLLSGSAAKNVQQLKTVHEKQANAYDGDPLLLHNLSESDIVLPRKQTPLGDLCCYLLPEDRETGDYSPFDDPTSDRVTRLPLPEYGVDAVRDWNDLCPGAGLMCVSSTEGHEFMLIKLRPSGAVLDDAVNALKAGVTEFGMPLAGRLAAYNPLSGQDVCEAEGIVQTGHYFVSESTGVLPPGSFLGYCGTLKLAEVRVHKFGPTPNNEAVFAMIDPQNKKKKRKKGAKLDAKTRARLELQINDEGKNFRGKKLSSIIWLREGEEGSKDPRTLANIYAIPREAWAPVVLKPSSSLAPAEVKKLLEDVGVFYGERAVPFPTLNEVAAAFPDRSRVAQQLANHRDWIKSLAPPNGEAVLDAAIATESRGQRRRLLEVDRKLCTNADARAAYLALLPP